MGAPVSLLGNARAFARDFPRDKMPQGYLWDVADYVPTLIDAQLTGRGGWQWGSGVADNDLTAGILASFSSGEQLLVGANATSSLYQVAQNAAGDLTYRGSVVVSSQNPIQYGDTTIWFPWNGSSPVQYVDSTGGGVNISTAKPGRVGAVWGQYVITGGVAGDESRLWFGPPNNPKGTWDANSFFPTSLPITGLAALRSVIIVFHASSTERIRGSTPPYTGDNAGSDLTREPLFSRAGTTDARSIAYWNENVLFADEHGVHITDGAVIRNLVSQGGISYFWRPLYANRLSLAATTFLDYYIITVRDSASTPWTLICDLNKRTWYRFTNIPALSYISSGGSTGMERVYAGLVGTNRMARIGSCFFPAFGAATQVDGNGTAVLPSFETPWYRLAQEGRKRVRFVYLSYDARLAGSQADDHAAPWRHEFPENEENGNGFAVPPAATVQVLAPVLDLGYIRSPQQLTYTSVGSLPATTEYKRYRLPVGQFPYGVAFRVRQTAATSALRVFDLGVEAQAGERSRV